MSILKDGLPEKGLGRGEVLSSLTNFLPHIADCESPIFGYPNGYPSEISLKAFSIFSSFQPNNIAGCEESIMSRGTNIMERESIEAIISLLGGEKEYFTGNITPGGTGANRQALQMARDNLLSIGLDDVQGGKKIAVFTSTMVHYSIIQICKLLQISESKWEKCEYCKDKQGGDLEHIFKEDYSGNGLRFVGVDENGSILLDGLERKIRESFEKGVRRFVVIVNIGTTLTGAVDNFVKISLILGKLKKEFNIVDRERKSFFYFHADAAYGGLMLPFINNYPLKYLLNLNKNYGLEGRGKEIDSITVDPHKWYTPYPCGVSIFRRGLEDEIKIRVPYLNGHGMYSSDGSRPGASAASLWANMAYFGFNGFEKKIASCLENTNLFYNLLKNVPGVKLFTPQLNIIRTSFFNDYLPKYFETKYYLCSSLFPDNPQDTNSHFKKIIYKFVIMDHWKEDEMKEFIKELENILKEKEYFKNNFL